MRRNHRNHNNRQGRQGGEGAPADSSRGGVSNTNGGNS
jgi:hypothetical protein